MKSSPALIAHAVLACLATALLSAPVALAAPAEDSTPLNLEPSDTAAQAAASGGGGSGGIVRVIVGLAIVLGVIYGLSWVLKQVRASRQAQSVGTGLEAVSSLTLAPNRSVHLVRVGSDLVLLGAAEHGVTPIRTYDAYQARDAGLLGDADDDEPALTPLPALPAPGRNGNGNGNGNAATVGGVLDALRQRTVRR